MHIDMKLNYDRARYDIGSSLIVEAGAGAGKTQALTERYAYTLVMDEAGEGCLPSQILAVTFTRKAAAEMRDRARHALGCYLRDDATIRRSLMDATPVRVSLKQKQHVHRCLFELGTAPIGTIDGFCADLLRRFPIEAGVDPDFSMLEPGAAGRRQADFLGRFLDDILREPDREGADEVRQLMAFYDLQLIRQTLVGLLALPDRALKELETTVREEQERQAATFFSAHKGFVAPWVRGLDSPNAAGALVEVSAALARFRASHSLADLLAIGSTVNLVGLDDDTKESLGFLRDVFLPEKNKEAWEYPRNAAAETVGVLRLFVAVAKAALQPLADQHQQGELAFDQVEASVLTMLKDNGRRERVRQALDLRHILVDEYQDTNSTQQQILYYLLGSAKPLSAEDPELPATGPRLFAVGDPKQSIYRFRGAEVEVFARTKKHLGPQRQLFLGYNYRARPALIDFNNYLFNDTEGVFSRFRDAVAELYEPQYVDQQQPPSPAGPALPAETSPLAESAVSPSPAVAGSVAAEAPGEPWPQSGQVVTCFFPANKARRRDESDSQEDDDDTAAEAEWIACQIQRLVATPSPYGQCQEKNGTQRDFRYGDVAILRRSVRNVDDLRRALAALTIPCYVSGSRGLAVCQEVDDVIQWLLCLATPDDDVALAACARQPCIGITNAELLTLHKATEAYRHGLPDVEAQKSCSHRLRYPTDRAPEAGETATAMFKAMARSLPSCLRHLELVADPETEEISKLNRKLQLFRERLEVLSAMAGRVPIADLAESVIMTNRMREVWSLLRTRPDAAETALANLEQFLNALRSQLGRSADMAGLATWIETFQDSAENGEEAQLAAEGDNVVRIMTIHHAKGLEFPVVFVDGLGSPDGGGGESRAVNLIPLAERFLPVVKLPDPQCPTILQAKYVDNLSIVVQQIDTLKDRAEKRRLFYVACTRAQQRLFLCGTAAKSVRKKGTNIWKGTNGVSWMACRFNLGFAAAETAGVQTRQERLVWNDSKAVKFLFPGFFNALPPASGSTSGAAAISACNPVSSPKLARPVALPLRLTQFAYVSLINPSREKQLSELMEAIPAADRSSPCYIAPPVPVVAMKDAALAASYGTSFHALMAAWDFSDATLGAVLTARIAADAASSDLAAQAALRTFLEGCIANFRNQEWEGQALQTLFRSALHEGRLAREVPFTHWLNPETADQAQPVWVTGSIDVLLERPGEIAVFDYKTGSIPVEHYKPQMALYVLAIRAAMGKVINVREPVLIYVERAADPS